MLQYIQPQDGKVLRDKMQMRMHRLNLDRQTDMRAYIQLDRRELKRGKKFNTEVGIECTCSYSVPDCGLPRCKPIPFRLRHVCPSLFIGRGGKGEAPGRVDI